MGEFERYGFSPIYISEQYFDDLGGFAGENKKAPIKTYTDTSYIKLDGRKKPKTKLTKVNLEY